MDEAASTKPPPYSTVIQHDRRLRDYPMPDCPIPGRSVDPTGHSFTECILLLQAKARGHPPQGLVY